MLIGDLVYSDSHDICFEYVIYKGNHGDDDLVYDSRADGAYKPPSNILDKEVTYITIDCCEHPRLIIEFESYNEDEMG